MGGAQTVPLSDYMMPLVAIMGVAVATGIGVKVTGWSRVGCRESVLGTTQAEVIGGLSSGSMQ